MPPKKFKVLSSAVLSTIALFLVTFLLVRHGQLLSQAKVSAAQSAIPGASPETAAPALPPGTITYQAKALTTAIFLARQNLTNSQYMTVAEFEEAIRKANGGKASFQRGETALIPGMEPQPVVEKSRPFPKDGEIRAVYLTGTTAGSAKGIELIRRWHEAGGNAVVFDVKDSDGGINVPFSHPLERKNQYHPISNLPKFVRFVHSLDMHAIARQALFRDDNIAKNHGNLAVQSRSLHQPWHENGKLVWADSSNKEVQEYNLALAKYVAESGADEIQFDYVRFPAEGNQEDAQFAFQKDPKVQRADVIAGFLDRAYTELHPMGVMVSLDVFGIMAWQRQVDLRHTGQDIVKMAQHCDVLSPMIYPSHFFGMDNIKVPGDAPEHFISISMDRFVKITAGSGVVIRPWLQAFRWRTPSYSPEYILKQVSTAKEHGGDGFLFWNAANDYSKPFAAMPVMMAHPKTYFYTPPTAVAQNSPAPTEAAKDKEQPAAPAAGDHP